MFAGVVQTIGVTSIAPFIALVTDSTLIHRNSYAQQLYVLLGSKSDQEFLIAIAILLMIVTVVTNAVLAVSTWAISSFSMRIGLALQQDIFRGFLRRDFESFAVTNSADLITIVAGEANRYVYMVLQPLLQVAGQGFVVLFLAVTLAVVDPMTALFATGLLGFGYLAIFSLVRKRLKHYGSIAYRLNARRFVILAESLTGIKEVKLAALEPEYEARFESVSHEALQSNIMSNLIGDLPRFVLEALAIGALLALGVYLLITTPDKSTVVGTLSLYAMAGYKLMPASQQLFKGASQIHSNADCLTRVLPSVADGRRAAGAPSAIEPPWPSDVPPIRFDNVTYQYPTAAAPALNDVTFEIPPRALTVLVGESGAGKSTAADLLLGLLRPRSGAVSAGGRRILEALAGWQQRIGFVAQDIFLSDGTIKDNILFGASTELDPVRLDEAITQAQLQTVVDNLPLGLETPVGEQGAQLSGGQRQRVGIARALYRDADVLVMDEATSALDTQTEREFLEALRALARSRTIVLIAHRTSTILAADHIVVFERGRVVGSGAYRQLIRECPVFDRLMSTGRDATGLNLPAAGHPRRDEPAGALFTVPAIGEVT